VEDVDQRDDVASSSSYANRFEGWTDAKEEAGIQVSTRFQQRSKSNEELLQNLRDLADELGKTPTQGDVEECGWCVSTKTYHNRFGGYNDALEEAGLDPNVKFNVTPDDADWRSYRTGPNWTERKRQTRARDGHECRLCETTKTATSTPDKKLHVHHITPRRRYWTEDGFDWTEVNDLSNLITLCPSCHGPRLECRDEFHELEPDEFVESVRDLLDIEPDHSEGGQTTLSAFGD